MKKNGMKWLALGMASLMGVGFFACDGTTGDDTTASADGYAYMAIDINPTVEFVLKADKVVSVDAVNDDAAVLVSEEEFVGMTAEEASETVVELAEQLGYLNEDNANVKITVAADDETQTDELTDKAKKGAKRGSGLAKVNSEPRTADCRKEKKLKEENPELYEGINPAKVRLIEAIMRYDETMTYETGAAMSFDELADLLEDYVEEYKELVGEQLREEYKAALEAKKQEAELAIAEKYGEEYKAQWEAYQAAKVAYKALEEKAENMVITAEDVSAIMELLGIEDAELISVSGTVTVDSVDNYLDKYCVEEYAASEAEEEALEAIEDAVEDILDKYDEDEYVLTEEDLTALQATLGEEIELEAGATLEDLEEIVEDLEEALEELREDIHLDKETHEDIFRLKEDMKGFKEEAHNELKDRIEEIKNQFKDEKQDRKELFEDGKLPELPSDEQVEDTTTEGTTVEGTVTEDTTTEEDVAA
ncbi:MAG: hypothetical protein IJ329_03200 [Clostridia bacterium]|nr:hypothetical protein [Clostridia bacterium]